MWHLPRAAQEERVDLNECWMGTIAFMQAVVGLVPRALDDVPPRCYTTPSGEARACARGGAAAAPGHTLPAAGARTAGAWVVRTQKLLVCGRCGNPVRQVSHMGSVPECTACGRVVRTHVIRAEAVTRRWGPGIWADPPLRNFRRQWVTLRNILLLSESASSTRKLPLLPPPRTNPPLPMQTPAVPCCHDAFHGFLASLHAVPTGRNPAANRRPALRDHCPPPPIVS